MPVALMPNLIGRGETQAKQALARLGIYMVLVDYQGRDRLGDRYDQFPAYAVVSHDPPPNSTVRPGMMVKLGVRAP
jgi:beta-lactam-binding protein with PASTA domain